MLTNATRTPPRTHGQTRGRNQRSLESATNQASLACSSSRNPALLHPPLRARWHACCQCTLPHTTASRLAPNRGARRTTNAARTARRGSSQHKPLLACSSALPPPRPLHAGAPARCRSDPLQCTSIPARGRTGTCCSCTAPLLGTHARRAYAGIDREHATRAQERKSVTSSQDGSACDSEQTRQLITRTVPCETLTRLCVLGENRSSDMDPASSRLCDVA
jgi:hypothetical protein